ncbi:hypothetical protein [Pollutibacter soli]|uniref:hypothetical protein n=1 Tax=Pollutibacter soli TaxID=3034157 RepID=UPI0030139A5C
MKSKYLFLLLLVTALTAAFSCKKDDNQCVSCKAVCNGNEVDELEYCGENADSEEATFRSQYPNCNVTCSRR